MKALDFKKFKKVREDEQKATLRHADGHELHIAKKGLSKALQSQLGALPMYDGGEVAERDNQQPNLKESFSQLKSKKKVEQDPDKAKSAQESMRKAFNFADGGEAPNFMDLIKPQETVIPFTPEHVEAGAYPGMSTPMGPNAADAPPPPVAAMPQEDNLPMPAVIPPSTPAASPAANNALADIYGQQAASTQAGAQNVLSGMRKEQQATSQQGKEQEQALAADQKRQQEIAQDYQSNLEDLNNERTRFIQDYQNKHINPNHYYENMDTGQRVATAIGLIAAGFSGAGESAGRFLNEQINRDIDAQKNEIDKGQNLLSANMRQFGNLKDATDMTRIMQNDLVSTQLKQAAAKAMDPMAKARLLQESGKFQMENAPLMQQLNLRTTLMKQASKGNVPPEQLISLVVPKEQQKDAYKELDEAKANSKLRDMALSAFDELDKSALGGRLTPGLRDSLIMPLTAVMGKELAGRYTEQDAKAFSALLPEAADSDKTRQRKRIGLLNLVNSKDNYSVLNSIPGLNLRPTGRFDVSGKPRITETPRPVK